MRVFSGVSTVFAVTAVLTGVTGGMATASPADLNCVAVYGSSGKAKVVGQPTELTLKSYNCDGVTAAWGKTVMKAWVDADYKGSSTEFQIDSTEDCDVDGYRWPTLPQGWDNVISSFRAYSTCQGVRLYVDTDTSGTCGSYQGDVSWVGETVNDKASSFRNSSEKKNC